MTFEQVYDAHVDSVFRFLAYRVASREAAEDLTQITFEKALSAWPKYDERKASVRTWLIVIARNALIDHTRADRGELPLSDEAAQRLTTHDIPHLGASSDLRDALASLGEREREVLGLRFVVELSGPEIAEITGLTVANVHQILSRSLRRLRGELEDDDSQGGRSYS